MKKKKSVEEITISEADISAAKSLREFLRPRHVMTIGITPIVPGETKVLYTRQKVDKNGKPVRELDENTGRAKPVFESKPGVITWVNRDTVHVVLDGDKHKAIIGKVRYSEIPLDNTFQLA